MLEISVLVFLQLALLAAVVILREPRLLIPAVVLGLPVEWLETRMQASLGDSGITGAVRSLLNPGQAAMAATVVVAVVRSRHNIRALIPNSALLVPIGLMFAVMVAGVGWSDFPTRPANSVLILPLYLGFILAAPSLIEDRRDIERIVCAFLAVAIVLSVIAVAQRVLGVYNWRSVLIQSDAYSYRANATFADPNNLARYLAITMALASGLILATGPRRLTLYLAIPALVLGLPAIVASASRSGWLALLMVGFVVVWASPIRRYTKARLTLSAFGGLAVALTLLFMQGGPDAERVRSLASGASAVGQREFLIRVGIQMWKDNPLIGVGSGNYQHALVVSYIEMIPEWARTTLSHTSTVSILAELGIVGFAAFLFLALRLLLTVVATYRQPGDGEHRLIVGWLGAAFLGILFQSQSEGRLLDEPYLWLLMAILIAFETKQAVRGAPSRGSAAEARPAEEGRPREAPAPAAPAPAPAPPGVAVPAGGE